MQDPNDWKFPTNPNSRHPSAELTRRGQQEERVAREIEEWRRSTRTRSAPQPAKRASSGRLQGLLLGIVSLLALLAGVVWLVGRAYEDRIYPNVVAGNVPVGSLTPAEASEKLSREVEPYLESPVTLQLGQTTWKPSAEDIGLSVDVDATVDRAYHAGRDGMAVTSVLRTVLGREKPVVVPLVTVLDPALLQRYLSDVGAQVNREAANPALRVRGDEVSVEGGEPGYTFLLEETQAEVVQALRSHSRRPVPVRVYSQQGPVSPEAVQQAEETARQILSGPVRLEADGRSWELGEEQLREWIRSTSTGSAQGASIQVRLDEVELGNYLKGIARELSRPASNARLQWTDGELEVIRPSQNGQRLDIRAAASMVQQAAASDHRAVQLPVRNVAPAISEGSVTSLGIQEEIGRGESAFRGSPPERVENVRRAADAITGFVVPEGGVFSFGEAVGEVTESAGYQPELVGDNQRSLQGDLTGISQVSTTVFRAALRAGLPILERHAAAYRYDYYEQDQQLPGTEAVVKLPGEDLKFENNTNAAILVQVVVGEDELRVELYGSDPGWSVEIRPPEVENLIQPQGDLYWQDPESQSEDSTTYLYARPGGEVTVTRRVLQGGEVVSEDPFYSRYEPLPTVFVRGSG